MFSYCTRKQNDGSQNQEDPAQSSIIPTTSKANKLGMDKRYDHPIEDDLDFHKPKAKQGLKESSSDEPHLDETLYNERVCTVQPDEIIITEPKYTQPNGAPVHYSGKENGSVNITDGHVNPSFIMESQDNETGESLFSTHL